MLSTHASDERAGLSEIDSSCFLVSVHKTFDP